MDEFRIAGIEILRPTAWTEPARVNNTWAAELDSFVEIKSLSV